jgi:23S rRNA pseudouridine1911/1915/1917 synthase
MKICLGILKEEDIRDKARVETQVLSFFMREVPECLEGRRPTRAFVQKWMQEGRLSTLEGPIGRKSRLREGLELFAELPHPEARPQAGSFQGPEVRILYEDADLLVVDKPAGLVTHRAPSVKGPVLVDWVLEQGYVLAPQGAPNRPGVVHRLDQWTKGAMVLARTSRAYEALVDLFSRHELLREYQALCYGCPRVSVFTVDRAIGRDPVHRLKQSIRSHTAKPSKTHVEVLECFQGFASRLRARLETGRTHQVRVHLTHMGHSILGDTVYGVPSPHQAKWQSLPLGVQGLLREAKGQLLIATLLAFKHPFQDKELRFEVEWSEAFRSVWEACKRSV